MVKILAEQTDAKLNARTTSDYTPLHIAAKNGHTEVVKYLVEKAGKIRDYPAEETDRVDILLRGLEDELPSSCAHDMNHYELGKYLEEHEKIKMRWRNYLRA